MNCSKLRRLIADGGPAALAGIQEAEDHLVDCAECLAVLEAMTEIDALLPALEGHDAADEVVEQLLARTELRETPDAGVEAPEGRLARFRVRINSLSLKPAVERLGAIFDSARQARLRWGIVAVPAVILIGIVSILTFRSVEVPLNSKAPHVFDQVKVEDSPSEGDERVKSEEWQQQDPQSGSVGSSVVTDAGEGGGDELARRFDVDQAGSQELSKPAAKRVRIPGPPSDQPESGKELNHVTAETTSVGVLGYPEAPVSSPEDKVRVPSGANPPAFKTSGEIDVAKTRPVEEAGRDQYATADRDQEMAEGTTRSTTEHDERLKNRGDDSLRSLNSPVVGDEAAGRHNEDTRHGSKKPNRKADQSRQDGNEFHRNSARLEDVEFESDDSFHNAEDRSLVTKVATEADDDAVFAAQRFLDERNRIEDLKFREARGYWANTYVPGDRTLRRLKATLDRADGAGVTGVLHNDARQISQPFDPPDAAALAVYLHSDQPVVETRERMLVQIGLKATSRRSGIRPAMNIGLVLDLRGQVGPEQATAIRALLQSFAAASELGDRFSLTVAGRPGGTILPPGDLRHGPLTVAMGEIFTDDAPGTALSLEQAIGTAMAAVRADEDPNAALGSSALVIITSRELGGLTSRLTHMAHLSAVDGVPWSVIGVGEAVDLAELDALVLAGQGNRRLLTSATDAEALVDRELAAVSRAVARAVRLRIRLAPGVQLVDVVGSYRLDEHRAQQVRDAEQSIDQRLSRNLGIQADRGLDEEGIQIVIPSYYADNAHVVLLDVVVPGPGPVADVTVRYKDLVHMKNGVVRAHLEVGRSGSTAGPLERNVLANLIATEVASSLDKAADAVAVGDIPGARMILSEALDLVRGITQLVDGLGQNRDLQADARMLAGYLDALAILPDGDRTQLQTAADSLRYAGRLKILPPPADDTTD